MGMSVSPCIEALEVKLKAMETGVGQAKVGQCRFNR
jgi:hypothetical protein